VQNFDVGLGFGGILAPDALATAARHYYSADARLLDPRQIVVLQAVVLAPEAQVVGVKTAAFFLVTRNDEIFAVRLHEPRESDGARLAAILIGRAAGKQERGGRRAAKLFQTQPSRPATALGA
jgi:hypothetical protein